MKTKDGRDLSVLEITAENYKVPQGEEMYVHAKIEVKQFDPKTGARISRPRVQKFGMKEWAASVYSSLRKQGYDVVVLHDPFVWQQENAAKLAEMKAVQVQAEKEAAEAAKAAELAAIKEQAKAELLAELKANGLIPGKETASESSAENETKKGPGRPAKDKE